MKLAAIIPARYASSRFPGKPLCDLLGLPMIIRVIHKVEQAIDKSSIYVATDHDLIKSTVEKHGYQTIMTSTKCLTGTDRLVEVSKTIAADIYLNVQGDEPMIDPNDIQMVIEAKRKYPNHVINAMCSLGKDEDPKNINIPKVVTDEKNNLVYMSRAGIPGVKSEKVGVPDYKKQVCIYAFNKEELRLFGSKKEKTKNEMYEDIEILRFTDLSHPVKMIEVSGSSLAVDTPEDLQKVIKKLKAKS